MKRVLARKVGCGRNESVAGRWVEIGRDICGNDHRWSFNRPKVGGESEALGIVTNGIGQPLVLRACQIILLAILFLQYLCFKNHKLLSGCILLGFVVTPVSRGHLYICRRHSGVNKLRTEQLLYSQTGSQLQNDKQDEERTVTAQSAGAVVSMQCC